jgi:hypothetical protein
MLMTKLSSPAQAILDAYQLAPIDDHLTAAAVLRSVADQVVPHDDLKGSDPDAWTRDDIRLELLAIADELEQLDDWAQEAADQDFVPGGFDSGFGSVDAAERAGFEASLCLGHVDFGVGQGVRDFVPARLVHCEKQEVA